MALSIDRFILPLHKYTKSTLMESNTTIDATTVDPEKNNAKEDRKRQMRRGLIAPLRRFWLNVLSGLSIVERDLGDSSADSTFGGNSDDEHERGNGPLECSSSQEAHGGRHRNMNALDERRTERRTGENQEYVDILGCDGSLAETIEDDIHIRVGSNGFYGGIKIINFPKSMEDYDNDSIIQEEVMSIGTEFIRPTAACCYCAERVVKSPLRRSAKKKKKAPKLQIIGNIANDNNFHHKTWNRADMTSMLSDDDKDNGEVPAEDNASPRVRNGVASPTVEECEARFMEELESSQNEHFNLENSHWKKGFDFVRS